ncbi:DUF4097 family beta strand repeat-containing protein [Natrarchaeobius chitinivorans]|uniref:DUF4097 domain-containing protein n=1 Tax=Natrarchaeobius chitinivorans TaxID=1679083 RepID=A0A3N6N2H0_NATCH|nr:DUF4097 family beta strand repeat-containing protein [Natrarchaeobius chitinivorans]RQG92212.1 hypothetical protein EA473_17000 [Natrarchaeobius chitinivorans]
MTAEQTRRALLGGVATTGLAALAGCSSMTPLVGQRLEQTETISLGDAESVLVHGNVGTVSVTGRDRDDVSVDAEKQSSSIRTDLEELRLRADHTDDGLVIGPEWEGREGWFQSEPSMNLEVELPRDLPLEEVRTSVGRVTVRDVTGDLAVETSTGRVDVDGVDGAVGARTSTGRVTIRDVDVLHDVTTSTGRVDAHVPAIDGDTTVSTSTGRIEAAIDPEIDADLHVTTSTGRIDVDDLELTDAAEGSDLVTGTLGDGGPTLRFETSTGRITLGSLS